MKACPAREEALALLKKYNSEATRARAPAGTPPAAISRRPPSRCGSDWARRRRPKCRLA